MVPGPVRAFGRPVAQQRTEVSRASRHWTGAFSNSGVGVLAINKAPIIFGVFRGLEVLVFREGVPWRDYLQVGFSCLLESKMLSYRTGRTLDRTLMARMVGRAGYMSSAFAVDLFVSGSLSIWLHHPRI